MPVDVTNELNTIRDTHTRKAMQAIIDALRADINEIATDLADHKTIFDAHTHNADGAQAGSYYTSPPRSNTATVSAGSATAFTNTVSAGLTD